MAVEPLSAALGALLFAAMVPDRFFRVVYAAGPMLFLIGTGLFALATSLPAAVLALTLAGLGMAGFTAGQMVLPLRAVRPQLRVRVVGLVTTSIGVAPFGLLQAGLLAEWLGAMAAQHVISLAGLIAMALTLRQWPELLHRRPPGAPNASG
jgi:predicted MFS family arabinose efflux permease